MNQDSLLGKQIDEYRFEALLGRGGMARVYRAVDTRLNRYTAIKVIDTPYRADDAYTRRFEQEARAIARLDHSNVVRVYRYGEVNGLLYIAMQYIEGSDLGYVLRAYQADGEYMDPNETLRITRDICRALDYIHANGIIHRDVKPSNIMLTRENAQAVLTDFGLALRAETGTRGEAFGSPHYIAPEQALSSAQAVPQSDLYSLGVILYEMFTGQVPFEASDPLDIAMLHMNAAPPPPRDIQPALSAGVEAVILKALEKQPADRYGSGQELVLNLEQALHGLDSPAQPRHTVAERVSTSLAANPLPQLPSTRPPVPQPAEAPTQQREGGPQAGLATVNLHAGEASRNAGGRPPVEPGTTHSLPPKKRRTTWLGVALAVTGLLMLACLALFGLALANRARQVVGGGARPTAAALTGDPAPSADVPRPTATSAPATRPASTATEDDSILLLFLRCEQEGCLMVVNQGRNPFPLAGLRLESRESGLRGEEWGIEALAPGACVRAVKNESWLERIPSGIACDPAGRVLLREGRRRFWKDDFKITHAGQSLGKCPKKETRCLIGTNP